MACVRAVVYAMFALAYTFALHSASVRAYVARAYPAVLLGVGNGDASTCAWNVTSAGVAVCNVDGLLTGAPPWRTTTLIAKMWTTHATSSFELIYLRDADVRVMGVEVQLVRRAYSALARNTSYVNDTSVRFETRTPIFIPFAPTSAYARAWGLENETQTYGSPIDYWSNPTENSIESAFTTTQQNFSLTLAFDAPDVGVEIGAIDVFIHFIRLSEITLEPTPAPPTLAPSSEPTREPTSAPSTSSEPTSATTATSSTLAPDTSTTPTPTRVTDASSSSSSSSSLSSSSSSSSTMPTSASSRASVAGTVVTLAEIQTIISFVAVGFACICFSLLATVAYVYSTRRAAAARVRPRRASESSFDERTYTSAHSLEYTPTVLERTPAANEYERVHLPPHGSRGSSDDDDERGSSGSGRRRQPRANTRVYDAAASPLESPPPAIYDAVALAPAVNSTYRSTVGGSENITQSRTLYMMLEMPSSEANDSELAAESTPRRRAYGDTSFGVESATLAYGDTSLTELARPSAPADTAQYADAPASLHLVARNV